MTRHSTARNLVACLLLALPVAQAKAVTAREVNTAFGQEIFVDENLWDDDVDALAQRLRWPLESKTSTDSSYRKYPRPDDRLLGCRSYSNALYGEEGKVSNMSLVFANKGDAVTYSPHALNNSKMASERDAQIRKFPQQIQNDKRNISEALTRLFGEPLADRFGQGRETRESVKRWDWNGHAFLLASPRDEYVVLRIMSVESANSGGKLRISDSEMRARVASRVERRSNGDVLLKDMPMVDQGAKGYCVPATWERVMRYMGVPADMYVLAMAGQTEVGGGTAIDAITAGASDTIMRSGRRAESASINFDALSVSKYIDRGLPLMWAMFSTQDYNNAINSRMAARRAMSDPKLWKKELANARMAAKKLIKDSRSRHICMIIGYNKETGEIAVSDSWGPEYAERWITADEAVAVTQASTVTLINF
jgi:hypothetical protein